MSKRLPFLLLVGLLTGGLTAPAAPVAAQRVPESPAVVDGGRPIPLGPEVGTPFDAGRGNPRVEGNDHLFYERVFKTPDLAGVFASQARLVVETARGEGVELTVDAAESAALGPDYLVLRDKDGMATVLYQSDHGWNGSLPDISRGRNWVLEALPGGVSRLTDRRPVDPVDLESDVPVRSDRPPGYVDESVRPPTAGVDGIPAFGPPDDVPDSRPVDVIEAAGSARDLTGPGGLLFTTSGFTVIDVALATTTSVPSTTWSSTSNHGKAAVAGANTTMINANLNTRFRLVGVQNAIPNLAGSGGVAADAMDQMQGQSAGSPTAFRNAVVELRTRSGADIVIAVVPDSRLSDAQAVAGGVPGPTGFPPLTEYGNVLARATSAAGSIGARLYAHELTHILGATHWNATTGEAYARGHYWSQGEAGAYGTLHGNTAVGTGGTLGTWLNYLSDPNATFQGFPLGVAGQRDNRQAVAKWDALSAELQPGYYCADHVLTPSVHVSDLYSRLTAAAIPSVTQTSLSNRIINGYNGSASYSTVDLVQSIRVTAAADRVEEMSRFYRTLLGRVPDQAGHRYWTQQLHAGMTLQTVVQNVMGSAEYVALHGARSDASFVQFLYQNGLGRTPDTAETNYWAGLVASNGRAWVTATITNSAEAANYQRWTAEAITLYFGLFLRTPDSGGVAYWSGVLAAGQWQQTILAYLTSGEYRLAC